jgi:hypothetical protein
VTVCVRICGAGLAFFRGVDLGLQTVLDCVAITLIRVRDDNLQTRIDVFATVDFTRGLDLDRDSEKGDDNGRESHDDVAVREIAGEGALVRVVRNITSV